MSQQNVVESKPDQTGNTDKAGNAATGALKLAQAFDLCQCIIDRVPNETAGHAAEQHKSFAWCMPVTPGNLNGSWAIYVLDELPGTGVPTDLYQYAVQLTTVQEAEQFIAGGSGVRSGPIAGQTPGVGRDTSRHGSSGSAGSGATPTS